MDEGLKTNQTKFFHYQKVNHNNSVRSFSMTYHKNQYSRIVRKHLKHFEDWNINDLAWKNKSFKQIIQSLLWT